MTNVRWIRGAAALFVVGLVAACGGGDDGYGSIAISESTARVAIVTGGLTQSIANDDARDECDADDCKVVLHFETCGAVSSALTTGDVRVFGVAAGGSAFDAQTAANNLCTANGGVGCTAIPNLPAECT